jgi:antitoxin HigA-1
MDNRLEAVHPGEVLEEEFLKPLGITKYRLAKGIGVSATRIGEIIAKKRPITTETALLLSRAFGTTAEFWINLQTQYDLEITEQQMRDRLNTIHQLLAEAA